jgi:hypothetical protein
MFRPRTLSPNTLSAEVKGLDYYLLPDLFSDCLVDGGIEQLVKERDEWFGRDVRFGHKYLEEMRKKQGADKGEDVVKRLGDDTRRSERDEFAPEGGSGAGHDARKRGRRAAKDDMIARAGEFGGFSEPTTLEPEIAEMLDGTRKVKVEQPVVGGGGGWMNGFELNNMGWGGRPQVGRGRVDEGYDTDEEEDRRRRRRLAGGINRSPKEVKVKSETLEVVQNSANLKSNDYHPPPPVISPEVIIKPEVTGIPVDSRVKGVQNQVKEEEVVKTEPGKIPEKPIVKRKRLSVTPGFRPRVVLNKEHFSASLSLK